ncbi:MAG: hypothetical protein ACK4FL_02955 [Microgenomates group bacterium]
MKSKERINVVFYGEESRFFSLGKEINYFLALSSEMEILVPGGYGYQRLGGLGKLSFLEKNPDIFKKTFSGALSTMIDLYFYPSTPKIYYHQTKTTHKLTFPSMREIFFNKTNGNIIDRLFLVFIFMDKNPSRFKIISNIPTSTKEERELFDEERFFKENQGLFYKKTYRNIGDNVQIIYTKSYKTAKLISGIIEGEGIRVVDISQISIFNPPVVNLPISQKDNCLVIENREKPSLISSDLQKFFGCQFRQGETEISDIILVLGKLEKEWEY